MPLKASAPGSLMLLGEHAVLHGKKALAAAVNKRITVTLTERADRIVTIFSKGFGRHTNHLDHFKIQKPFSFVLGVMAYHQKYFQTGCDIKIDSEFSHQIGLGSSAAVTVALTSVVRTYLDLPNTNNIILQIARDIIRRIQGAGSGADAAASVYGGMIAYHADTSFVKKLNEIHPISVLYAGFKTPTVAVIQAVEQKFKSHPDLFRYIINSIGECSEEGIKQVEQGNWRKLGELFKVQQGLMVSLGVSQSILNLMVEDLQSYISILGAKISGSGLGDCVLGLGTLPSDYRVKQHHVGVKQIETNMTKIGVQNE